MSIASAKRVLRALPYTEMRALGDQIIAGLHVRRKPGQVGIVGVELDDMCDVLATLPPDDGKTLALESEYLARAFTKKRGGKSELILKPEPGGAWRVTAGDFTHIAPSVRQAVSELFDQIAAYEALMK